MHRPSRKSSARVLWRGREPLRVVYHHPETVRLYGNVGSWDWVEDRDYIRVCEPCAVVYPPGTSACPRHGPTIWVPSDQFRLER